MTRIGGRKDARDVSIRRSRFQKRDVSEELLLHRCGSEQCWGEGEAVQGEPLLGGVREFEGWSPVNEAGLVVGGTIGA